MKNKVTFRQILKEVEKTNVESLAKKAITANRLAKTLYGRSRRNAYRVKTETIIYVAKKMPKFVKIKEDKYLEDFYVVEFVLTNRSLHLPKSSIGKREN
ncbi:MAG: hypothetical protein N2Z23_07440 [Pyrinomonadaceae bacterium]|nr:hypothetical protein [Pyrinomonadaceae bacterium]MCX7640257.1 hypothetical protein [Pyrinomonadaceae bacterium]MDW8305416.1 hypothetical protein [Acidobacteriota bacterium]